MSRGVLLGRAAPGGTTDAAATDEATVGAAHGLMHRGFALASACADVAAAWRQCVDSGWEAAASWLVGTARPAAGFLTADSAAAVWERERRSPIFAAAGQLRAHLDGNHWRGELALTNGVFDLLHVGHVRSLRAARAHGDLLVVALNSDHSVASLQRRPVQGQFARAELLAALKPVDYVVLFDEPDPRAVIAELRPAVLVKGGDYRPDQVVGAELLAGWGGRVVVTGYEAEHSSTALAHQARRRAQGV